MHDLDTLARMNAKAEERENQMYAIPYARGYLAALVRACIAADNGEDVVKLLYAMRDEAQQRFAEVSR